jgi:hypothetical protein
MVPNRMMLAALPVKVSGVPTVIFSKGKRFRGE